MLIIHNWYTDWIYIAGEDGDFDRLTLRQRRLRAASGFRVVYDGQLAEHVPAAENLDVWGCLWNPAVEFFIHTAVGQGDGRVDCWFGEIAAPRDLGQEGQAHAVLRQAKILARPCQLVLELPQPQPQPRRARRQRVVGW